MTRLPRWGVSALDWHAHAVDLGVEHPSGVWITRCGLRLIGGTSLYDEPPPDSDRICPHCLRPTEREDTGEVTEPPPAVGCRGRWARSPLDYHAHLLLPDSDQPSGVLTAHCGARMTSSVTQHEQPLPGLTCARCHLVFLAGSRPRVE